MQAHHYPFIDLAVHAAVRDRFAHGDAVAVLSTNLEAVLWANGAAADLFGFDTIYDVLEEGLSNQPVTRRQIQSALSGLQRTGRPQSFMMRLTRGFSRAMTPASLENISLPDGGQALLVSSQAGSVLAPGARARQIISGFEGTGTHVAVLDAEGAVLAASRTFEALGLDDADIARMIADVAREDDRLVKRMVDAGSGAMPAAIGRLTDEPLMHLLFAVEQASYDEAADDEAADDKAGDEPDTAAGASPEAIASGPASEIATAEPSAENGYGEGAPPADDDPDNTGDAEAGSQAGTSAGTETETGTGEAGSGGVPVGIGAGFDPDRVREELSERANAAPDPDDIPTPFAEARGLEIEPAGDASDTVESNDGGGEDRGDQQIAPTGDASAAYEQSGSATVTGRQSSTPEPAGLGDVLGADNGKDMAEAPEFRFDPAAKPARFVWKINQEGAFSEVSPEFAAAVGPNAADIVGRKFPDLARVFNLDPDHVIADLLNRRDTWSGKTVYWPIQGTDLVTPVDLAALPTYTRDRRFDGFRGFGIVRSGETRKDPEALGLALVPGAPLAWEELDDAADQSGEDGPNERDDSAAAPSGHGETVEDDAALEDMEMAEDMADLTRIDGATPLDLDAPAADEDVAESRDVDDDAATDPFRGERPAIRLVETPMRRDSDKIISLEARRARPAREGLSAGEQAAFREIGERLTEESGSTDETDGGETTHEPNQPQTPFGKRQPPLDRPQTEPRDVEVTFDDQPQADADPGADPDAERESLAQDDVQGESESATEAEDSAETKAENPAETEAKDATEPDADGGSGGRDEPGDASTIIAEPHEGPAAPAQTGQSTEQPGAAAAAESQAPLASSLPSAFALPARQVMHAGLDADLVDAIPSPLLVHAGDELIHANPEFLELTGYGALAELASAGGLDHLLDRPGGDAGLDDSSLIVRRGDGGLRRVTARLRSVNWNEGQALLLALTPVGDPETAAIDTVPAANGPDAATTVPGVEALDPDQQTRADTLAIEAQELRSILETATDGVVILDDDGTIRSMNSSACALFNYNENETLRQPFAMLFAHESQRAVMDYVNGLSEHGVSSVLNDGREVIGREASGGFLPLFMTIGRLSGSKGYCAVLRDITQWKRTEDELRTAKRAAETANSHKSDFSPGSATRSAHRSMRSSAFLK
jgi:PAS domain S-box-containing protein